jgi:ubiquinone/menaquinone biosynthesis C-methylase UbiE
MDCVLAARRVGPSGRVIGVDMTPEMVNRARAATADLAQVSIRLGEIEHLPVADASVDVVLSNCVMNLSPEKRAVYAEAMRVLRPGGRLAIADVVLLKPLPDALASRWEALSGCVAGAATAEQVEGWLRELGFEAIAVTPQPSSRAVIASWLPGSGAEDYVASATISAVRPTAAAA